MSESTIKVVVSPSGEKWVSVEKYDAVLARVQKAEAELARVKAASGCPHNHIVVADAARKAKAESAAAVELAEAYCALSPGAGVKRLEAAEAAYRKAKEGK